MRLLISIFTFVLLASSCSQQQLRPKLDPQFNGYILHDENDQSYLIYLSDSSSYNIAPGVLDTTTMTFSFPIYE